MTMAVALLSVALRGPTHSPQCTSLISDQSYISWFSTQLYQTKPNQAVQVYNACIVWDHWYHLV